MNPTPFDVNIHRLLVQCTDGRILTMNEVGRAENIREPLGMATHGWDRTAADGEVTSSEFVTDTGYLIRDDRIVRDGGTSTAVTLPQQFSDPDAIVATAEDASSGGLLGRAGLSDRRRRYLVDNATAVADDLNPIFRQVVTEFWIGWYSAEGLAYGVDGVYELDFANESNPELREIAVDDHKQRVVDQTRLAADQADAVLSLLPSTIEVTVDVFADGEQIL